LLGASHSAEIIGKNVLDFIQPEFHDTVMKNREKDLEGEITSREDVPGGDFWARHSRNDVRGRERSKGIPAFESIRCRLYRGADAGYGLHYEGGVGRYLRQSHTDRPEIKPIITSSV